MDYEPFKDYLSLSTVACDLGLLNDLNRIMSPPKCRSSSVHGTVWGSDSDRRLGEFFVNDGIATDPLDEDRFNAYDEFRRNGVDSALDEIDEYQHQIREVRALTEVDKTPAPGYYVNRQNKRKKKVCVFCRNNGELPTLYNSHVVKDDDGKVSCPVLRNYTCPLCGTSGDTAHTVRYCPKNNSGASPGLLLLINSTRDSAGRLKVRR